MAVFKDLDLPLNNQLYHVLTLDLCTSSSAFQIILKDFIIHFS